MTATRLFLPVPQSSIPQADRAGRDEDLLRLLRLVIEHVPQGVLIFDDGGDIIVANRQAETIFAYPAGHMTGLPMGRLFVDGLPGVNVREGRHSGPSPLSLVRETDGFVAGIRRDHATVPLEVSLEPLEDGQTRYVVASVSDVTRRQRSESGPDGDPFDPSAGVTSEDHVKGIRNVLPAVPVNRGRRGDDRPLRRDAADSQSGAIVGGSAAIRRVLELACQVAATDSTVLLLGETGTGKELIATHIHEHSARRARAMVRVNCSAIPATLMESELFGREKGAYTGALSRQIGRFELADQSTIFLDEIGDLPAEVQVKLLRVLEDKQIERLGNPKAVPVNIRIIAATHRNLEKRIAEDEFRDDLFYRLNVFPIEVPPLRDRPEDIPLLVWRFVDEFSRSFGKQIHTISTDNMATLRHYSWPGNIRELRNVVERAMIAATGSELTITVPKLTAPVTRRSLRMTDVEKDHILSVLESTGWRIRGAGGAAERLGFRPTTLETRMAKLGLTRPKH
jgi:PAS domain S-box-containing protein